MGTMIKWLWWVGVDWARRSHAVCVVNPAGERVKEFGVANTPEGLAGLVAKLTEWCRGDRSAMCVAIEVPHGPVVDALLEAGFAVFTTNPKQIDRFRDRYSPSGAKDDRRDAFVQANALRTDPEAFQRIEPDPPAVVELREWSRIDQQAGKELLAEANALSAQLMRVAPHWLRICPAANEPWFWSMLELAPTPKEALTLTVRRIQTVLRHHRIRRVAAAEVLATWQAACQGTPAGVFTAVAAHVKMLLPRLRLLHEQRRQAEVEMARSLKALEPVFRTKPERPSDVRIALSQPGLGVRLAARLFGDAGRCIAARNCQGFRAQTGTCPVTKQSGKTRLVLMRRARDARLQDACYHWARVAAMHDPRAKAHYATLMRKGHRHARALRGVADRLISRFFAMLEQGTVYDPNHRRVPSGQNNA
ncbi:MAG: IS110 family transposase [Candidatus Lambdaproteobacteria bacterium]|nr:IS110 family transposase [Candidatus Lambdaproteobacteria bacterium]